MKSKIFCILIVITLFATSIVSGKEDNNDYELINSEGIIILDSSLGITLPNVDLAHIVDKTPILKEEQQELEKNNSSLSKEKNLTRDDFKKEKDKWEISEYAQNLIKEIYPELEDLNIKKWTYEDINNYSQATDIYRYLSNDELNKLKDRGITKEDSFTLIKEFGNYENLYSATDETLISYLEDYYKFKISYCNEIKAKEKESKNHISSIFPGIKAYAALYVPSGYTAVYVPGYGTDAFLTSTMTHYADNRFVAGAATQKLWAELYLPWTQGVRNTYRAGNLWGTYSLSKHYAHEGIDFNATPFEEDDVVLHAIMSGGYGDELYLSGYSSYGYKIIGTSNDYVVYYMHAAKPDNYVLGNVSDNDETYLEGTKGTDNLHTHFSVNIGHTATPGVYDGVLTSSNPYTFADKHTDGTYTWDWSIY